MHCGVAFVASVNSGTKVPTPGAWLLGIWPETTGTERRIGVLPVHLRRKARKIQIANNRLQRQQARARFQHKRAERLLADNRFAARSQLWLDRASKRLFKQ